MRTPKKLGPPIGGFGTA